MNWAGKKEVSHSSLSVFWAMLIWLFLVLSSQPTLPDMLAVTLHLSLSIFCLSPFLWYFSPSSCQCLFSADGDHDLPFSTVLTAFQRKRRVDSNIAYGTDFRAALIREDLAEAMLAARSQRIKQQEDQDRVLAEQMSNFAVTQQQHSDTTQLDSQTAYDDSAGTAFSI